MSESAAPIMSLEEVEQLHAALTAQVPFGSVQRDPSVKLPPDRKVLIAWLMTRHALKRLKETHNPCYAANVWKVYRHMGMSHLMPEEVLLYFDAAADSGELFSRSGKGRGHLSDLRKYTRDFKEDRWIREAIQLYGRKQLSQNELAAALGIDPAEFSRLSSARDEELPWRHWERNG